MVEFFPELTIIKTLNPQPTPGELALLNFLKEYFKDFGDEPFEVYYQPHWDGSLPDVVIMRKNHGILIIEVKDWNLDLYKIENHNTWICTKPQGNSETQKIKSPIAQASYYKNLFYNTTSRTLAEKKLMDRKIYSLVESAVFFYGVSTDKLKKFFGDHIKQEKNVLSSNWVTLLTFEDLKNFGLQNTRNANFLLNYRTKFFDEEIYNELRRVLKPSEHSKFKALSKILTPKQKELATSKVAVKIKVRGPAGCGKTTVLAYRAVDAFIKKHAPIVILTFNITLRNYIKDCISAALGDIPNKNFILKNYFIINHFHGFIKDYCEKNNLKVSPNFELEKPLPIKYATILVDEVQDYERGWMETVMELLADGGEIVFFGDKDQDIYERREIEHIPEITGRWNELKGSYRLRGKIADIARAFQIKFFAGSKGNEIETGQTELTLSEETVEYYPLHKFDIPAIIKIFKDNPVSNDDICIMSLYVKNGRLLDKALRDRNYKTMTTFETEEAHLEIKRRFNAIIAKNPELKFDRRTLQDVRKKLQEKKFLNENEKKLQPILELEDELNSLRRTAKFNFWMESGKIKLSTIHSYKGWGVDTEILLIGDDGTEKDSWFEYENDIFQHINSEIIYVAITRAVKHLIIINIGNDSGYDDFFINWVKNN